VILGERGSDGIIHPANNPARRLYNGRGHIYRHHRRYRLTEGSEEVQIRNIARSLFGFGDRPPGRTADV
jgi:hypothetical protein